VIPGNQTLSFGPLLLCAAAAIEAQKDHEITPFAGCRFGRNIYLSQQGNRNADYLKIKGSEDYGVMAGPPFAFFTHIPRIPHRRRPRLLWPCLVSGKPEQPEEISQAVKIPWDRHPNCPLGSEPQE
jgi:hypothetical protein